MFLSLLLGSPGCCQGHCGHGAPEPGGDRSFGGNTGEGHPGILCKESSGGEQHYFIWDLMSEFVFHFVENLFSVSSFT